MDLSDVPFEVPVILHSVFTKKNLQNPVGTKKARCLASNRDVYEQMVLHRQPNDKVAIQSVRNGRYLHVRVNGGCVFDSQEVTERGLFTLETNLTCSIFFVSSYMGNVLQCNDKLIASCDNKNHRLWEEWRVMEPQITTTPVVHQSLSVQERIHLTVELAKCGKSVDEIEQVVTHLFDGPVTSSSSSAYAVRVDKA